MLQDQSTAVLELKRQIAKLEQAGYAPQLPKISIGIAAVDANLPDGLLPQGCLHEVGAKGLKSVGAATGFISALASRMAGTRYVAWISREAAAYMPGLVSFGLQPHRTVFVQAKNERSVLWAMEEALRSNAFAVVLGEVEKADLTASRRLQLAAETGCSTGIILRLKANEESSVCVSRWIIESAPSLRQLSTPGVGDPCWHVQLDKIKGGQPGAWLLAWTDSGFKQVQPEQLQPARVRALA